MNIPNYIASKSEGEKNPEVTEPSIPVSSSKCSYQTGQWGAVKKEKDKAPALGARVKNPLLYGNKGAENDYLTEQLFQHQQCLRTSICPRNPVC